MSRFEPSVSWIASFVAVVDQGTFTAAADATNRSQPRISSHVASLETSLGVELLIRRSRRVQLTTAGIRFLPHARSALKAVRQGGDAVETHAESMQGLIRVGSYPGAMAVILAPVTHRYQTMHPGVSVELKEGHPELLEDAVAAQEIDAAIRTADVPQRRHDVPSVPLFQERIMLVTRRDHPLAQRPADPSKLGNDPIIVTGHPPTGWADYQERLNRIGIEPPQIKPVTEPTTVVALVREGLGVGLLGALAAKVTVHNQEVVATALPTPLWLRNIHVYYPARTNPSKPLTEFFDLLKQDGPGLTPGQATWPD